MSNARDKANIPSLNFSSTGIDDNATSTAITIDSLGKVGIGTASPTSALHIQNTTGDKRRLRIAYDGTYYYDFSQLGAGGLSFNAVGGLFHIWQNNGSEVMRIRNDGHVGIGTSSPSTKLTVSSGASSASVHSYSKLEIESSDHSALQFSGSTNAEQWIWFADDTTATPVGGITYNHIGPYMGFRVEGSERMRIDSSGRVGIGTSSPQDILDLGNGTQGRGIVWGGAGGGSHYGSIWSEYGTGSIVVGAGLKGSTNSSDFIYPYTGTYGYAAIELDSFQDDGIKFYTAADGARTSGTVVTKNERMRIDTNGNVGIGTSSPTHKLSVSGQVSMTGIESTYTQKSFIKSSNGNNYTLEVHNTAATPASQYIMDVSFTGASPDNSAAKFFQMRDSTTARVNINSDGDLQNHDNSYGGISDERVKQNIVDASSQWNDIKNIRVRKYKKKHDVIQYGEENAPNEIGVISQELETVSPGLIKEDKADSSHAELHEDFTGDNPQNVKYVKYSILYMKSIKALQEAMERIETLEAKVTALETTTP